MFKLFIELLLPKSAPTTNTPILPPSNSFPTPPDNFLFTIIIISAIHNPVILPKPGMCPSNSPDIYI